MHSELDAICVALDDLATSVVTVFPDERILTETYGWYAPSITRTEAAEFASQLSIDIRAANSDNFPEILSKFVQQTPHRVQLIKTNVVPQFASGNMGPAFLAYLTTLEVIRKKILPNIGWVSVVDENALPSKLTKRVTSARRQLDALENKLPQLGTKIDEIELAHSLAENLSIDLETLEEARRKVAQAVTDTSLQQAKIEDNGASSIRYLQEMKDYSTTAEKLIEQCEEAYQITTTKGLAGAFDQRAISLAWSMRGWVVGLLIALAVGSILGTYRLTSLSVALSSDTPKWGLLAAQILLSVLSVGAPLWFSWLATKQIGQRFRLSEDYAFKASVAKAYEGYRKEAAKLDPEFSAKLFGSALQRLDEAPLRLVEVEQHASPWQEFANSDSIKQAIKLAPELQSKLVDVVKGAMENATKAAGETAKAVSEASKQAPPTPVPPTT